MVNNLVVFFIIIIVRIREKNCLKIEMFDFFIIVFYFNEF